MVKPTYEGGGEKNMKKVMGLIVAVFAFVAFSSTAVFAGDPPASFNKCKACHKADQDGSAWTVGPGLKGVGARLSAAFLDKWLKDPQATFDAGGPEIEALKKGAKFNAKLKMPAAVKGMADGDRAALIAYLGSL